MDNISETSIQKSDNISVKLESALRNIHSDLCSAEQFFRLFSFPDSHAANRIGAIPFRLLSSALICGTEPGSMSIRMPSCSALILLEAGKLRVNLEGKDCTLNAGACLCLADSGSSWSGNLTASVLAAPLRSRICFFTSKQPECIQRLLGSFFPAKLSPFSIIPERMTELARLCGPMSTPDCLRTSRDISDILYELAESAAQGAKEQTAPVPEKHEAVLSIIRRNSPTERPNYIPPYLSDMKNYLDHHFDQKCPLADMEERSGVSRYRLLREFEKYYSVTPGKYLQELRIEKAKEMLPATSLNIHEIAGSCGYENVTHFIRLFRNATGMTPGEFRKKQA